MSSLFRRRPDRPIALATVTHTKLLIVCMTATLTGCMVGPNYKRPAVASPPQFRAGEPQPAAASLGDAKWFDIFQDDALRDLIKQALDANYDIRIAAQRVLQAEGQLQATRSALFPQINGTGNAGRAGLQSPIQSSGVIGLGAVWELDFFGKLRRASEAARADMLAADENKKVVMQTLVAQVATAYFNLLDYDAELVFVRESITARRESAKLVTTRLEGGVSNRVELDQAKTLVSTAETSAVLLEEAQEQTENLINFLIGKDPGPVKRGNVLMDQKQPPEVPAGLPSSLLERRPDLKEAEQQLVAANARVGVAKAAFYPSINLTAAGGYGSSDLLGIANRSGFAYTVGGFLDVPIFDAGRRTGN